MNNELKIITKKIDNIFFSSSFPKTVQLPFLQKSLISYPKNGGKRIRPAICQWFCGAVNGEQNTAWQISAALEMFHTWTLVHDDIIDRDDTRRNQPTCHKQLANYAIETYSANQQDAEHFGNSMAILVGDLQQAWVYNLIDNSVINTDTKALIRQLFSDSITVDVLCGEALDIKFEYCSFETISSEEILQMINLKTAKLLELCAKVGVIIGLKLTNLNHPLIKEATHYANNLGLAFQLQDDLLGIFAKESELGKPTGNDIEKKKITLLYKKSLEFTSRSEHQFLLDILGKDMLTKKEFEYAKKIIVNCGSKQFIQQEIHQYYSNAIKSLKQFSNQKNTLLLEQLADFVIHRKF